MRSKNLILASTLAWFACFFNASAFASDAAAIVEKLYVSGVMSGPKPAIGIRFDWESKVRFFREGEVVDSTLGLRVLSIDLSASQVVFVDNTGAKYSKHFGSGRPNPTQPPEK